MTKFWVVQNTGGDFLTNRKPTGKVQYESRSGWSEDLQNAKVFSTKGAATNSARHNGESDFEVVPVKLEFIDRD